MLSAGSRSEALLDFLRRSFREHGLNEGAHYTLEPRFANKDLAVLARMAEDLVKLNVDVIVSIATRPAIEVRKLTTTIPIVLFSGGDPIGAGLVRSLGRPATNVTGTSNSLTDIAPKHLDLLRDLVPKLSLVAVLMNPAYKSHRDALKTIQGLALNLKLKVLPVDAGSAGEIDRGFVRMAREKAEALIVIFDPIFDDLAKQIADLATNGKLPTIGYAYRYAQAGCLMSYGADEADIGRLSVTYVVKILNGSKPADLPIEQPRKFEFAVNLKTAKALGIAIPQSLLARADRVIE